MTDTHPPSSDAGQTTKIASAAGSAAGTSYAVSAAAKATAELVFRQAPPILARLFPFPFGYLYSRLLPPEPNKTIEQEKTELVSQLLVAGIDPLLFDVLLANEIDRRLKTQYGVAFVVLTCVFTAASYALIALNARWGLGISDLAMTGLIIETPIQFVGLLYIIARNLFPNAPAHGPLARGTSSLSAERKKKKGSKKKPKMADSVDHEQT